MHPVFPAPLQPGDLIGVTGPSSGVGERERGRLEFAIQWLRDRGFRVEVGECMDGTGHISAPASARAAELMRMLLDPAIRAVIPPWGGETAIDLLPLLDFDALAGAEPTWFVGYSDVSTLLTPLTLRSGWATIHGPNLMDTPYELPETLASWLDIVMAPRGTVIRQSPANLHRANDHDDWSVQPDVTTHNWTGTGTWRRLDAGLEPVDAVGRLIGGCIETLANVVGTPFGSPTLLRGGSGQEPTLVYLEAAEDNAFDICRNLHGMRLAGFFDGASAILIGRTAAPDMDSLSQDEAVVDALGSLGVPIVADIECGHVPPQMSLVNGAMARVVHSDAESYLEQRIG
ncbi:S66 peptidase family protein [Mycetocola zhujimingii]|uniref:LD-carboxypeptidase n=1 Tax=Mycetocola zhujimingii TaxID=2079792 RepID=A0A2U1TCI7_9MICO|nr:S66 peptidase family protein [Mycetocola zhujimingii]PWC06594.1 LD-carboxypeptidase [Mycetocola zhujimingii]